MPTRIPSVATGRVPRRRLPGRFRPATIPLTRTPIPGQFSPVFLPHSPFPGLPSLSQPYFTLMPDEGKARGDEPYCEARPAFEVGRSAFGYGCLQKGRNCSCPNHDHSVPFNDYRTDPRSWATTPAESGIDPDPPYRVVNNPPRKVRFADNLVKVCKSVKPREACFPQVPKTRDKTRRIKDFPEGFPLYN